MESQSQFRPAHLEPSPLGTKEYWDKLYQTEISNHKADPNDLGTIWFDDSAAEDKLLTFLHSPSLALDLEHTSFLDIGTGNGHLLLRLREPFPSEAERDHENENEDEPEGARGKKSAFQGRMLGTDYSPKSVEFARRIAASGNVFPEIAFLHHDIMASAPAAILTPPNEAGFDVVLDKGTFDAISLSDECLPGASGSDGGGKRLCEGYKDKIIPLVKEGGLFLVTSCNWTEEELRGWFEDADDRDRGGEGAFVFEIGLKYRTFRFGGSEGQSISSVCFRKRTRKMGSQHSIAAHGSFHG